jgi:acetyl esterase
MSQKAHGNWGQMTLDGSTAQFLEQMAAADVTTIHRMSPEQAPALGRQLSQISGPGPDVGSLRDESVLGASAQVPLRILTPDSPLRRR